MISIVLKTFKQIKKNKTTALFKSHNNKFSNGEQKRDFIYVKDCIKVLMWFLEKEKISLLKNIIKEIQNISENLDNHNNYEKKIDELNKELSVLKKGIRESIGELEEFLEEENARS